MEGGRDRDTHTVAALLEQGSADVNALDSGLRMNALMWAAKHGRVETARELLRHGAAVQGQDKIGQSGLHWAAQATALPPPRPWCTPICVV